MAPEAAEQSEPERELEMAESWKERVFRDFWLIVSVTPACLSAYLLER